MEKRIISKLDAHQLAFKNSIKEWVETQVQNGTTINPSELLQFVFDFENLSLNKEDFQKRKRVKNAVPQFERCTARRANGEQCTRRKKDNSCFCGTHIKGTPHGVLAEDGKIVEDMKKIEVWVQEIKGINYYIDADKNVYEPSDIITSCQKPRKIGQWVFENDEYSIPQLDEYA